MSFCEHDVKNAFFFLTLALTCCLTFYYSHVYLHGILEEFLFRLPFYVFFHTHGLFLHLWWCGMG